MILEKDLPSVHKILCEPSVVLPRGRNGFSHILIKDSQKIIYNRRAIKTEDVGPFWPSDKEITGAETLSFKKITLGQTIRMNELFLSARVDYFTGGVDISFVFMLDGYVFRKCDFASNGYAWKLPEQKPMAYIMSDLAIPSCEKRLAKLVLMCLLSQEIKQVLDYKYIDRMGYAVTTAFSQHPVSMKYRGIFKLHKRIEKENGYALNYYAPFAQYQLSEVLDLWAKKYKK